MGSLTTDPGVTSLNPNLGHITFVEIDLIVISTSYSTVC